DTDVDGETALDHAGDAAGNDLFGIERAGQIIQVARPWTGHAGQLGHSLIVEAGDRDIERVADLHGEIALTVFEVRDVNHALGFRAVVNQHRVAGDADYRSLQARRAGA